MAEQILQDATLGEGVSSYGMCHCGCGEQTNIATRTISQSGHKKGEPFRYIRGHFKRKARHGYKIEDHGYKSPCWVWTGVLVSNGYGSFAVGSGENHKKIYAHRHSYEVAFGEIPDGLQIDHLCRVHACINPLHLEAVTPAVNVQRGYAARGKTKRSKPKSSRRNRRLHENLLGRLLAECERRGVEFGECWCGCGNKTSIAQRTHSKDLAIKGYPQRYLVGHSGLEAINAKG